VSSLVDLETGGWAAVGAGGGSNAPTAPGGLAGLSGRVLAERLVEIEVVRRRLEAETLAVLGEVERSGVFRDDGHITVGGWARATVNWSYRDTADRLRAVQLARLCPAAASELAEGRLGVAQIFELARARANRRVGDQIAGQIDELIGWAETLEFDGFRTVLRRWEQLADVDGAHHSHEAAHQGRRAVMSQFDGTFHLNAQFGVAQGATMVGILDAFTEAEYHTDRDTANHGDATGAGVMVRSGSQRRADALHAIFLAAVADRDGIVPAPLVNLVCDQQTFEEHLTRLTGRHVPPDAADHPVAAPASDPTDHPAGGNGSVSMGTGLGLRRCEAIDGVAIDPGDVVAAAIIGHVRRVVLDRAGVVINCGRKARLFTGTARAMAWLQGTTCCWPGCGHRHGIQIDHLDDYARDGPTDQHNADPLDGYHNRFKTTHHYRIRRDNHGIIHIHRPDGTEIRPH
jgi:hypothetical protein